MWCTCIVRVFSALVFLAVIMNLERNTLGQQPIEFIIFLPQMETSIDCLFPWSSPMSERGIQGKFVLCSEFPGAWSGDFVGLTLLSQVLRGGKASCLLICTGRDKKHYEAVLRKQVLLLLPKYFKM